MSESTAAWRPLWTVHDVATFLGVPVGTIYQWRTRGEGPPAIRLGRHLRYDRAAVLAWVERQSEAA
jgi:excisionase family DNA binding protein